MTPNEITEEEMATRLETAGSALPAGCPWVLVTHEPPFGTLTDAAQPGGHVGSRALRSFVERRRPLACFTGHIHEAAGLDRVGVTPVVNPGPLQAGRYAYAEIRTGLGTLEIRRLPS